VLVDQPPSVKKVVSRGFNPRPTGQTARKERVEVVPQVVNDVFCELLWESSRRGLNGLFLLRKPRPNVLVERGFQPGEKRGFLRIDLCALLVRSCPPERRVSRGFTSITRTMRWRRSLSTDIWAAVETALEGSSEAAVSVLGSAVSVIGPGLPQSDRLGTDFRWILCLSHKPNSRFPQRPSNPHVRLWDSIVSGLRLRLRHDLQSARGPSPETGSSNHSGIPQGDLKSPKSCSTTP